MPLDTGIPAFRAGFLRFCVRGVNLSAPECTGLLIAQKRPLGTAPADEIVQVLSPAHANELFGADSIAARMAHLYFCQCGGYLGNGALYMLPVIDDAEGTAAEFKMCFTGTATESGSVTFELFGVKYSVPIAIGTLPIDIATAVMAEINADPTSLFAAEFRPEDIPTNHPHGCISLVAKHKGTALNHAVVVFNSIYGQQFPAGVTASWERVITGAGDPDISDAMAALGSCCYDCWGLGFEDPVATDLLVQEIRNRWDCAKDQCFGHLFTSRTEGTVAELITYAQSFNHAERNIIPVLDTYKYPGWMFVATWAGRQCCSACEDPARPVVRDNGILACMEDSARCGGGIFNMYEKEQMVDAGLSVWTFNRSGQIYIETNRTNWKYATLGDPDVTWENTERRYIAKALVEFLRRFYVTHYSSSVLFDDGTSLPAGSRATTPSLLKGHIVGELETTFGFLLNDSSLERDVIVEKDTDGRPAGYGDASRLNVALSAHVANQLLRIATCVNVVVR